MKLSRWNGESDLRVLTDLIQIESNFDLDIYSKPADSMFEHGADELEVILNSKPRVNSIAFPIESKNLVFYYQPPLTQKELMEGAFRPEPIEGSYAVYHPYLRGNEYKAGKLFHIPRPLLIDNVGEKAWGTIEITNNLMKLELPKRFLDKAVYPVSVDPTFGKTDIGESAVSLAGDNKLFCIFPLTENGDVTKITAYGYGFADSHIKGMIYSVTSGTPDYPDVLKGTTPENDIPTGSKIWKDLAFSSPISLTMDDWALSLIFDNAWYYNYDAGASNQGGRNADTYSDGPSNPFGDPDAWWDIAISMYATYTTEEEVKPVGSIVPQVLALMRAGVLN